MGSTCRIDSGSESQEVGGRLSPGKRSLKTWPGQWQRQRKPPVSVGSRACYRNIVAAHFLNLLLLPRMPSTAPNGLT